MRTQPMLTPGGSLDVLFRPRSVAIVGVSGRSVRSGNFSSLALTNLRRAGFTGSVYPVNPKYDRLEGYDCYPSVEEIPENLDLALLLVPAARIADTVRECAAKGARFAVVGASGFAETGEAGMRRQHELMSVAREVGVRVVGPNSLGLMFVPSGLVASFSPAMHSSLVDSEGTVAYVGQSGAVGGSIMDIARQAGLPLTAWLSTGNQADVDLFEAACYLLTQPEIRIVTLYAESLGQGEGITSVGRAARLTGKRVVLLRSGRSEAGRRAVSSHTGAIVGPGTAFDAVAREEGIVLASDVDDLIRKAHALTRHRPAGRRIAIISGSGGAASILADRCSDYGLDLPELPAQVQQRLGQWIPDYGALANPVDVTSAGARNDGEGFAEVCLAVAECDQIDQIIAVMGMMTDAAGAEPFSHTLVSAAAKINKPLHYVWLAAEDQTPAGRAVLQTDGFPVFRSVSESASIARFLADLSEAQLPRGRDDPAPVVPDGKDLLGLLPGPLVIEAEAGGLLDAIGVPRPRGGLAKTVEEAERIGAALEGPLVLKLQSRAVLHKSELGAVRTGVAHDEIAVVYADLMSLASDEVLGVLVQQLVAPGLELLVGVEGGSDGFPPLLTVGLGGVFAEIYRDVTSRPVPFGSARAEDLLTRLQAAPLLHGYRRGRRYDVAAAADVIARISSAAAALSGSIDELEINPLIVGPDGSGVAAVDFFARVRAPSGTSPWR
jgi:acetate---CoA ligase (ADP-forming)